MPDKATWEESWDGKLIEKSLSKEEIAKAAKPEELRTIVRQEIWNPVLRAVPSTK
jgi:hypothetical protein